VNRYLPGSLSLLPSSRHRLKQSGYSLYDLIITAAVASVLGTGAIGMSSLLQDARMTAGVNQLMAELSLARSEAINVDQQLLSAPARQALNARDLENGMTAG